MTAGRFAALVISLVSTACADADPPPRQADTAQPSAPSQVDPRDQYALAREIAEARRDAMHPDGSALARVRQAWLGQRVRWELGVLPALCSAPDRCHVLPFDHARATDASTQQGFLPALALAPATHTDLLARCSHVERCVITVEATLAELVLSSDEPVRVQLGEIVLGDARSTRKDESWVVAIHRKRPRVAAAPAPHADVLLP